MAGKTALRRRQHLYFVRSKTGWTSDDFYLSKPDYWVFGDEEGFAHLAESLRKQCRARRILDLDTVPITSSNSQPVLILPAKDAPKSPRIRIVERCAFRGPLFVMELIIVGNKPGLEKLAQRVESLDPTDSDQQAFDDHLHVNDWHDRWVVRESISLNLRAPVKRWPRNAKQSYGFIFDPELKKLPEESGYLTPETTPYALPDLKSKTFQLTDSCRWS